MDKNLCLPSGACSGLCDQGRLCKRSQEASALALGLHRLVQVEERKSNALDYLMAALVVFFVLGLAFSVFK